MGSAAATRGPGLRGPKLARSALAGLLLVSCEGPVGPSRDSPEPGANAADPITLEELPTIHRAVEPVLREGEGPPVVALEAELPAPRLGAVSLLEGSVPLEAARRVVEEHLGEIAYCRQRSTTAAPGAARTMQFRLVVSPTGAVLEARVTPGEPAAAEPDGCVAQALRRWPFPAPGGGLPATLSVAIELPAGGTAGAPSTAAPVRASASRSDR